MLRKLIPPAALMVAGAAFVNLASAADAKMATSDMLVNTCVACHGTSGVSAGPAIPSLAGLTRNYLIGAMLAYKFHDDEEALEKTIDERGEAFEDVEAFPRYSTIMSRLASGYTVEEIEVIADYFAAQEPQPVSQEADPAMAEAGRKLHNAKCDKCHEDGGFSPKDDVGLLAGQWVPYLRYTFQDYADGKRAMPKKMKTKMKEVREEYGEKGFEQLIHYYGSAK